MPRRIAGGDPLRRHVPALRARASTMPRRIAGGDYAARWTRLRLKLRLQRCPGELPGETRRSGHVRGSVQPASTMPRRIAGGDHRRDGHARARERASTMPRRIAGGDSPRPKARFAVLSRFNDAPANCRGRPAMDDLIAEKYGLLQRCPGELPGETGGGGIECPPTLRCFNDAPANCRGRQHGSNPLFT